MTHNPQIFNLGLSVEATSLYLLLDGLKDQHNRVSREQAQSVWNLSLEQFDQALEKLGALGIITQGADGFTLLPEASWKVE